MNFELDSEQEMLRDSVRRWVKTEYEFEKRKPIVQSAEGFRRDHWRTMADLGWLGAALPEAVGGLEGSMIEVAIIAEELGRALVLEPYIPVAVLAASLIERAADEARREEWLSAIATGERIIALAHNEQQARGDLAFVETSARKDAGGWRLSGAKSMVLGGVGADLFIISARTAGQAGDADGLSLFAVSPDQAGLSRRDYGLVDGGRATDLTLDGVLVPEDALIGVAGGAFAAIAAAYQRAMVASCAEAVGTMDEVLWMTRDYMRTREQYGVKIGTFQALQHRAADMFVETDIARAALWRALALMDDADPAVRNRAVISAKIQVGAAAKYVCSQAVQLHGGIAVTEEFAVGHYYKRMHVFDATFGRASAHLARMARQIAKGAAA